MNKFDSGFFITLLLYLVKQDMGTHRITDYNIFF